jgi:hypothetical protein
MGSRYLTDLANVCRSIGVTVHEENGWQTRARGSGGYNSGLPNHVMCHHTASNPSSDGQSDVNYMCYGSDNRPVANLYLSRKGQIWVMAAGATNTNGKGSDTWGGGVPNDSMNSYAIGIEAANNGVGEPWPAVQQNAYVLLVSALCAHYGIPNNNIRAHFEWAPGRKIDPAGQSDYATGSNKWNMDAFRKDCGWVGPPTPTPPQLQGDIEVSLCVQCEDGSPEQNFATFALNIGTSIGWVTSQAQVDVGRICGTLQFHGETGEPLHNFGHAELQDMIDRYWAGGPKPPGFK